MPSVQPVELLIANRARDPPESANRLRAQVTDHRCERLLRWILRFRRRCVVLAYPTDYLDNAMPPLPSVRADSEASLHADAGARFVDCLQDRVMYLSDDRDHSPEDLRSLVILQGGNGDWYVQVAGANGRTFEGVRICTSGGASTHCPGLGVAIADAFRAMKASAAGEPAPESTNCLREEVHAWRTRFPDLVFDRFAIVPACE